jgi:hypothetical protein
MLKIKNILPVLAVLVVMSLAGTAFAQVTCNVGSTPVSRDTSTGLTEPAGDITLICTQTGTNPSAANVTITITYAGVPITNDTSIPGANYLGGGGPAKPIAVAAVGGGCSATAPTVVVNNPAGSVVITLPAVGVNQGDICNYTLSGVLLGLSGSGATSPLKATISASAVTPPLTIASGADTPTVVTNILVPIVASGVAVATGPGLVPTTGTTGTDAPFPTHWSITTTENYFDMFKDRANFNGGAASNGVQLKYTFGGIPTGATISGCTASMTNGGTVTGPGGVALTTTASSTSPSITAEVNSVVAANLTAIDTITFGCTTFNNGTATLPLTPGSITVSVSLAPLGSALSATNTVLSGATTGQIPRYSGPSFGPFTVINIIPLTTHMILPFVAVGNGFDTGIVIANTTADPYGPTAGGARPISGPVTVAFFPAGGGTPFCVSTGAGAATVAGITSCSTVTAGTGLTSGSVNSGSSWSVLTSQLVAGSPGAPAAFTGYAFAIANFPFAHPTAFVADATFSGKFASGGPALVLPNPAVAGRQTSPGFSSILAESLGH